MSIFQTLFRFGRKAASTPDAREPGLEFSAAVVSDIGRLRGNNEDNYILDTHMNPGCADHSEAALSGAKGIWHLAGVFDGMGGGEAGELASTGAAELFLQAFSAFGAETCKAGVDAALRRAFLQANNNIIDLQQTYQIYGTTGTVLCSDAREFKLYHLGDSRAYLFREGQLFQLTKDQTLAQLKLETGLYTRDDPRFEAEKHKLTEYIGRDWTKENLKPVESIWNQILPGDRILLCSDGLYDFCTDEMITEILRNDSTITDQAAALVAAANENGGEDNITCILISFN